jgi:branched-chain amino acid transport system ATP-binding protein
VLEAIDLVGGYGGLDVLHGVSLKVPSGALVSLLGPNGAGKTTLVRAISGLLRCRQGSVYLAGQPIHDLPAEEIVELGVIQVPQGRMLFPELTVEENLELGAYRRAARRRIVASLADVYALFPVLASRRRQRAGVLSGGEQQMLAIGRALMASPRFLILDEPSLGLAPRITEHIFGVIRQINDAGVPVLLVEQNARLALGIARHCYVLRQGRIAAQGTTTELLGNEQIRRIYLGIR